jgi:pyrroline-5-carboxylate reductase
MKPTAIITFVGPGVMAEAMFSGLIRQHVATSNQIVITGPEVDRGEELVAKYGVTSFSDNRLAVQGAEIVILSVKPQRLRHVLKGLQGSIPPQALVLSIVAGASIQTIQTGLDHPNVVRAMPNTPAQIGAGITVWTCSSTVTAEQNDLARQILTALGEEIFVEEEPYLDMATAVSGTGPAYVFLFLEAMIDAGVHLGLPRRTAEEMVVQTFVGSVEFYKKNKLHPAALRNQVTSPGGTSAAAIYYLEKAGFRTAISRAIWAAYERSLELGKGIEQTRLEKNNSNE